MPLDIAKKNAKISNTKRWNKFGNKKEVGVNNKEREMKRKSGRNKSGLWATPLGGGGGILKK
jgi:hypothetical protein